MGNFMGRQADGLRAVDFDRAFAIACQAEHGAHGGRTSGAVAPKQRDHAAFWHGHVYAMQNMGLAIPGVQVLNFKCVCAHACAPCSTPSAVPIYASMTARLVDTVR